MRSLLYSRKERIADDKLQVGFSKEVNNSNYDQLLILFLYVLLNGPPRWRKSLTNERTLHHINENCGEIKS